MRQFAGIQYGDDADGYHQRGQQGRYQATVLFDEVQGIEIDAEREQRRLGRRSKDNSKQYATKDDARHEGCNDGHAVTAYFCRLRLTDFVNHRESSFQLAAELLAVGKSWTEVVEKYL